MASSAAVLGSISHFPTNSYLGRALRISGTWTELAECESWGSQLVSSGNGLRIGCCPTLENEMAHSLFPRLGLSRNGDPLRA
jgi:hypothetical protein